MTFIISNFFQKSGESGESDLSLHVSLLLKNFLWDFFILCTVMEHTSLCSKIVRKVKLLYMDRWLFWIKNCLWEKMFLLIRKSG